MIARIKHVVDLRSSKSANLFVSSCFEETFQPRLEECYIVVAAGSVKGVFLDVEKAKTELTLEPFDMKRKTQIYTVHHSGTHIYIYIYV